MTGELALVEEGLFARDRRHGNRRETRLGDPGQRPAHQLGFEQRQPALEAIGAASRHLRDPRQIAPVVGLDQRDVVPGFKSESRRLALGADDDVEAFVRADRRAVPGNAGKAHHHRIQRHLLVAERLFELAGLGARFLRLTAKFGLFLRAGVLEFRADGVAFGTQPLDLGLEPPHFGIEREQRVEVDIDPLVANRALDIGAVGLDEFQAQHGQLPSARRSSRKLSRSAAGGSCRGNRARDRAPNRSSP